MTRTEIINTLIQIHNFKKYLEIGVFKGENIKGVNCEIKYGVDPGVEDELCDEVTHKMYSDEFFEQNKETFDIVFIDGLHHSEQVDKDICNALECTHDYGIIVLHDCNPPTKKHAAVPREQGEWNGDVYKSVLRFQISNEKHSFITVDTDWGVGIILKNRGIYRKYNKESYQTGIDNWDYFFQNKDELLNLISINYFKNLFTGNGI